MLWLKPQAVREMGLERGGRDGRVRNGRRGALWRGRCRSNGSSTWDGMILVFELGWVGVCARGGAEGVEGFICGLRS